MGDVSGDFYNLERFVQAHSGGVYERALGELRAGRKASHWMWFIFPQLAGLGRSPTAEFYAISTLDEARAYLRHPVLGPRLLECTAALIELPDGAGRGAEQIMGPVDAMKLRSSMTLFLRAKPDQGAFAQVLDRYFGGEADSATDSLLGTGE